MRRGLMEYLFQYYAYDIGIREISKDKSLPTKSNPREYHLLRATQKEWYADPFCIECNENTFVFFEVMDQTGKGRIGVSSYEEGTFGPVVSVLEEPFHLSVITISVIHTESRCNRHDGDDYTYNDQFQHIFHLIRKIK